MSPIEQLAGDARAALKSGAGSERRARQRARLLAAPFRRERGARLAWRWAPVAAALALACWFGLRLPLPSNALSVAGEPALTSGRWLRVPDDRAMLLDFADGTSIRFEPQSASRLGLRSPSQAHVTLESGGLKAAVRPAAVTGRSWAFDAGPYEVLVIGTELDITWNAEHAGLSVHVEHGRVRVRGGPLGDEGIALGSGDRLTADGAHLELRRGGQLVPNEPSAAPSSPQAPTPASAPAPSSTSNAPSTEAPRVAPSGSSARPGAAPAPKPTASEPAAPRVTWESLARSGDYSEALSLAEQEGFDQLVARLPVVQLELLADTARLSRKPSANRAQQALSALRQRFPATEPANRAAFRLGLLALAARDYGAASRWFETYLRAAPGGTFAADASGRLIEAKERLGDRRGAEAAARAYLEHFPNGPYAQVARGVLRGDTLAR
jgi:transmembrane sensor